MHEMILALTCLVLLISSSKHKNVGCFCFHSFAVLSKVAFGVHVVHSGLQNVSKVHLRYT